MTQSPGCPCLPLAVPTLSPHPVFTQLVITALKCHKYDKNIQVTGSAALFYLTNSEYRSEQSVKLRRQVIQVVLNGMESYQEVTVSPCLLRPACFGPIHLPAPQGPRHTGPPGLGGLCQFSSHSCFPRNLPLAHRDPRSWLQLQFSVHGHHTSTLCAPGLPFSLPLSLITVGGGAGSSTCF